jgi:hypothetical protein
MAESIAQLATKMLDARFDDGPDSFCDGDVPDALEELVALEWIAGHGPDLTDLTTASPSAKAKTPTVAESAPQMGIDV